MNEKSIKQRLLAEIPTKRFGHNLFVFKDIDSTNSCALALAETGAEEGTVVWTDYQRSGKGRHGRTWVGDAEKNLMFSIILRDFSLPHASFLPYYISEAVAGGIERVVEESVQIKWPNDLLLNDRKICGILIETGGKEGQRFAVAGVGINVNQEVLPPDLQRTASSLLLQRGAEIDRRILYHSILENAERLVDAVRKGGEKKVMDAWMDRCTTIGKDISVAYGNDTITGEAKGLSKDGGLLIETSAGYRTVYAGDVTLRPPRGVI